MKPVNDPEKVLSMSWYEVVRDTLCTAKKLGQIELYEKLLNLREGMSRLRDDNIAKPERIREFQEQLTRSALIVFERSVCWIRIVATVLLVAGSNTINVG